MMKKALALFLCLTILVPVCPASADSEIPYKYDANGNLVSGDGKYFEYNDANKLVRVRQSDANGPVLAEYVYDHAGQRIKKIENGVTTYYVGKLYEEEYTGGQQTGKASYYFANGQRVAKKDNNGKMLYFHADHLGGTNVVMDDSGNQVERTKYYPFGDIREGGNERYSFTGKEKDKATDFYYFEARHYNPGYRHFTQADTIVPNPYDPQSLNRYAYVNNNPLKYIDPSGHDFESAKAVLYSFFRGICIYDVPIGLIILPKTIVHSPNDSLSKDIQNDSRYNNYINDKISEAERNNQTEIGDGDKPKIYYKDPDTKNSLSQNAKNAESVNLRGLDDIGHTVGLSDQTEIQGSKQQDGSWHIKSTIAFLSDPWKYLRITPPLPLPGTERETHRETPPLPSQGRGRGLGRTDPGSEFFRK